MHKILLNLFIFISIFLVYVSFVNASSSVSDVLLLGETKTYILDGKDYELTFKKFREPTEVEFIINGEISPPLLEGKTHVFENGTITLTDITFPDSVEFILSNNMLAITDLDVKVDGVLDKNLENGSTIDRVGYPKSNVEFIIEVTNLFNLPTNVYINDTLVIVIVKGIDNDNDIKLESYQFNQTADRSRRVSLEFNIPENVEANLYDVQIEVEGEDDNGLTHSDRMEVGLRVEVPTLPNASGGGGSITNKLIISDLDAKVDGRKSSNLEDGDRIKREAKPESEIEFKIEVENAFTDEEDLEIEDIMVEVIIEDIDDGDELEEESRDFDLRQGKDKTVEISFDIPLEVDEDTYDVEIHVEGEDENGTTHEIDWTLELEVEKEKHDIQIIKANLNPSTIGCQRSFTLNIEIINLGSEDEEEVVLEILNNDLEININQRNIELNEGTEDNRFSKLWRFTVSDKLNSGIYPISINSYYDDSELSDSEIVELIINKCEVAEEEEEEEVEEEEIIVEQPLVTEPIIQVEPLEKKNILQKIIDWFLDLFR